MAENCTESNAGSFDMVRLVGGLVLCYLLFKFLRSLWRGLYSCVLAELFGATVNWKKLGKWAVITGSTDGIGKAYAKALAAKGFDIVLVSRNPEKLEDVAQEIEKKYSVKTKIVSIDFTADSSIYDKVAREINGLEIGVLVNNVGMSYLYAEYLTKIPDAEKFVENIIKANITSCLRMSLLVLSSMEKRRKGVILNVSSLSAISPVPLLSIYSASKVFVNFFSKATAEEYRAKGIIVQSVLPGFVSTKMSKMRPSMTTCTPEAFVRWALKTVGVEDQTFGYPMHKLQGYVQEIAAEYLPEKLNLSINHRMMNDIRRRYYKKFGLVDSEKKDNVKEK